MIVTKSNAKPKDPINKRVRMVCNYVNLNTYTTDIPQIIPLQKALFAIIREGKAFAFLDLRDGFYQLPVEES
jgi:hypothetical protein